jgi:cysteine desulfurase
MLPWFSERFGNAASVQHAMGRAAHEAVEAARHQVAAVIGAAPEEIVWTSGATESNNLALRGVIRAMGDRGRHIITQVTEHKAVLEVCQHLQKEGCEVTYLPVDDRGRVDPAQVEAAIRPDTVLVSIMAGNNELGTLQPLAGIGRICRRHGALFHSDAAQAFGKVPLNVDALQVDLLSIAGHKIYAPKGIGALYIRREPAVPCEPILFGSGHEGGRRPGTTNVPGVVALGKAAEVAATDMDADAARQRELRERLWTGLLREVPDARRNGDPENALPNTLSVALPGVRVEDLVPALPEICLSTGSACSSGSTQVSYVLRAVGLPDDLARGTLRLSLGRFTTRAEIDLAVSRIGAAVHRLRAGGRG